MPTSGSQDDPTRRAPSPVLVAIAGWLVPGAGYWLIAERARGMVVGITIIILFTAGTLIGGVRAIQVPGYGEEGGKLYVWYELQPDPKNPKRDIPTGRTMVSETVPQPIPPDRFRKSGQGPWVATDFRALLADIGNKPWSICQVLAGPVAVAGGAASVWASRPADADGGATAPGELSHSRINEIAVLYTAVAGMLNLLVVIDAAARASRAQRAVHTSSGALAAGAPA